LISKTASKRGQPIPTAAPAAAVGGGGQVRTGFGRKGLKPNIPASRRAPPPPARRPTVSVPPPAPPVFPGYTYTFPKKTSKPLGLKEWLLAFGFGIVLFAIIVPKEPRRSPPPPEVSVPDLAPDSEAALSRPIAVDFDSGTVTGPPNFLQINETSDAARNVALGNVHGRDDETNAAMQQLLSAFPAAAAVDRDRRANYQARFGAFMPKALAASRDARWAMMRALALDLHADPYDAESACEWSWLARLVEERDYARNGFLRTIWADPQYWCGWLGAGTMSEETEIAFGQLIMAEQLQQGEARDYDARDQLVEAAFAPEPKRLDRWRVLDARARVRAAARRGDAVPEQIRQRADQLLDPEPGKE
jgi:hypothetical protein